MDSQYFPRHGWSSWIGLESRKSTSKVDPCSLRVMCCLLWSSWLREGLAEGRIMEEHLFKNWSEGKKMEINQKLLLPEPKVAQ